MYQYERNSRVYMKGEGERSPSGGGGGGRPSSRGSSSALQESGNKPAHHRSQTLQSNGKQSPRELNGAGTPTLHHHSTKSLKESQQRAVSSELGELTAPGETKTKTQMARAFQESQELFKSADSKAGLQTVKTRRVLKKTTTITKGENEKVGCWLGEFFFVFLFENFSLFFILRFFFSLFLLQNLSKKKINTHY